MTDEIPQNVLDAITRGNVAEIERWLDRDRGQLMARMNNKETMLHKAAYAGQIEVIRFLVRRGLPLNVVDTGGYSVLHEAARNNKPEAVRVLLELGADPDAKRVDGSTVDSIAKDKGAQEILKLLERARLKPRWVKTAEDEVTHVTHKFDVGYRLTEMFNFKSRSYILLSRNLETGGESVFQKNFADFADRQQLIEARNQLMRLGGTIPDEFDNLDKPKKGLSSRNLA